MRSDMPWDVDGAEVAPFACFVDLDLVAVEEMANEGVSVGGPVCPFKPRTVAFGLGAVK